MPKSSGTVSTQAGSGSAPPSARKYGATSNTRRQRPPATPCAFSSGPPSLRPSALSAIALTTCGRPSASTRCSVTRMPAAGRPWAVSRTWVLRCPIARSSEVVLGAQHRRLGEGAVARRAVPVVAELVLPVFVLDPDAPGHRLGADQAAGVPHHLAV